MSSKITLHIKHQFDINILSNNQNSKHLSIKTKYLYTCTVTTAGTYPHSTYKVTLSKEHVTRDTHHTRVKLK